MDIEHQQLSSPLNDSALLFILQTLIQSSNQPSFSSLDQNPQQNPQEINNPSIESILQQIQLLQTFQQLATPQQQQQEIQQEQMKQIHMENYKEYCEDNTPSTQAYLNVRFQPNEHSVQPKRQSSESNQQQPLPIIPKVISPNNKGVIENQNDFIPDSLVRVGNTSNYPIESGISEEMQLFSLISQCLSLDQIIKTTGSGENEIQNAAIAAIMMAPDAGNDSGEDNAKYHHLLTTPSTCSNMVNRSTSKKFSNQAGISSVNGGIGFVNQGILSNLNTNLGTFFENLNSDNKKINSPTHTSAFIPHIISPPQQQKQSQPLVYSPMLCTLDPITLQALIAQHGMDTPDLLRLREQKRLERQFKIERYKNKRRNWIRKISYDCRKRVADSRLRIKGRFISKKDSEKLKHRSTDDLSSCPQENTLEQHQLQLDQSYLNTLPMELEDQDHIHNHRTFEISSKNKNYNHSSRIFNSGQNQQKTFEVQAITSSKITAGGADVSISSLDQNNRNFGDEIGFFLLNQQSSSEITCALNSQLRPEMMMKVKQRIANKKPLFSLITTSDILSRTIQELHNHSKKDITIPSNNVLFPQII